jgi:hypothetical protein
VAAAAESRKSETLPLVEVETEFAFDERFAMLVDAEWLHRENRRLTRALKEAKLKLSQACVEDIDCPPR